MISNLPRLRACAGDIQAQSHMTAEEELPSSWDVWIEYYRPWLRCSFLHPLEQICVAKLNIETGAAPGCSSAVVVWNMVSCSFPVSCIHGWSSWYRCMPMQAFSDKSVVKWWRRAKGGTIAVFRTQTGIGANFHSLCRCDLRTHRWARSGKLTAWVTFAKSGPLSA